MFVSCPIVGRITPPFDRFPFSWHDTNTGRARDSGNDLASLVAGNIETIYLGSMKGRHQRPPEGRVNHGPGQPVYLPGHQAGRV